MKLDIKNKKLRLILVVISFLMLAFVLKSNNKYNNSRDKTLLTISKDFGIIRSIENIVMTCMGTSGTKNLLLDTKLDIVDLYILNNKEKFRDVLLLENSNYYIKAHDYTNIYNMIFEEEELHLDDTIKLQYKDVNYFSFDTCTTLKVEKLDADTYIIYNKYKRELNGVINDVYTKYILNSSGHVKDVIILESVV